MFLFIPRFLENVARGTDDDGVGRDDEGGFAGGRVQFATVDVCGFLFGGLQDVFEGGEGFGEGFGEGGGDDFEVCEADLWGRGDGLARMWFV